MRDKGSIIQSAQEMAARGQIDKAISELKRILDDRDGDVYNSIGDLYVRKGLKKEAIAYFKKAAALYREDGSHPKAIALFKKILNIDPSDINTVIASAELNAERGLTGNAVQDYMQIAETFMRDGVKEKATAFYEKALRLAPFDINVRTKITEIYLRMGLKERAATGYSGIGLVYYEKGDLNKAKEFYQKATEIYPDTVSSLLGFSKIFEKLNDLNTALEYLSRAKNCVPENKKILFSYAKLAIDASHTEEAKKALLLLIEKDPADTEAKQHLGLLYLREGDFERAWDELVPCIDEKIHTHELDEVMEILTQLKDVYPLPVRERLIEIHKIIGDREALLKECKELSKIYEEKGLKKNALRIYQEILAIEPDNTAVKKKVQSLSKAQ